MFSLVARSSRTQLRASVRAFSVSAARPNLVSDLYVKEVKAFKAKPLTAADAEEATKPWKLPQPLKAPALEGEGADALSEYDAQTVDTAAAPAADAAAPAASYDPDGWFVFEEEDTHHH